MKNIRFAICLFLLAGFTIAPAQDDPQDAHLKEMKTRHGRIYREIQIIKADEDGLMFRHQGGIAKEDFSVLPVIYRDRYQKVSGTIPPPPIAGADDATEVRDPADAAPEADEETSKTGDLLLTFRLRQRIYLPLSPGCAETAHCRLHRHPGNWPSHWHKFHYAHYLTNPVCRELATRDFLYTTGLRPLPPGVHVHRLPSATPFTFR